MTNEQLTKEVMKLTEHQAKCDAERENIIMIIEELREDVKSTKSLAEDVHIMAVEMKTLHQAQTDTNRQLAETNKKVDAISSQEFFEYKENKKILKNNIISAIGGSIGTGLLALIIWFVSNFMKGGG